jgi:2-methylcitrate dehydratase PrpD
MLHTAIDAVLTICRDQTIPVNEIARVRVGTSRLVATHLNDPAPATLIDATFSLQHALAAALLRLPAGPEWFTPQTMSSPAIKSLIGRISVEVDGAADDAFKEIGRYQATVEILSTSGVRSSLTSHESPVLPMRDLGSKFERLVYPVVGQERGAVLLNSLLSIVECANIEPILISIEQLKN